MKGPNSWLAAQPTIAQNHYLTKREFEDAIRLKSGIEPREMAEKCACGATNNVIYARNCHL